MYCSKVICNWCESIFNEEKIIVKNEEEYCPVCNRSGCLMDKTQAEYKMKEYKIPVEWAVYGIITVRAETRDKASAEAHIEAEKKWEEFNSAFNNKGLVAVYKIDPDEEDMK